MSIDVLSAGGGIKSLQNLTFFDNGQWEYFNPVDPSKAVLLHLGVRGEGYDMFQHPVYGLYPERVIPRNSTPSGDKISLQVVEFRGVKVQRYYFSMTGSVENLTIAPVNLEKTILIFDGFLDHGTWTGRDFPIWELTAENNIYLRRREADHAYKGDVQVIEYA